MDWMKTNRFDFRSKPPYQQTSTDLTTVIVAAIPLALTFLFIATETVLWLTGLIFGK